MRTSPPPRGRVRVVAQGRVGFLRNGASIAMSILTLIDIPPCSNREPPGKKMERQGIRITMPESLGVYISDLV